MNIDDLEFDPNPLESRKVDGVRRTRYGIDEEDQLAFELDEAEWFCDGCSELILDIDDPDCSCLIE